MMYKTKNYMMVVVILFTLLSCKKEGKEDNDSDITFTENCDFSRQNVENVHKLTGSLIYTNNIMNFPPLEIPPSAKYKFYIQSSGRLAMAICNMPFDFEMVEGESRGIQFSGRVVVLPDGIYPTMDAFSTSVELSYLKFEDKE